MFAYVNFTSTYIFEANLALVVEEYVDLVERYMARHLISSECMEKKLVLRDSLPEPVRQIRPSLVSACTARRDGSI